MIQISGISQKFKENNSELCNISIDAFDGNIYALKGANGSGKSVPLPSSLRTTYFRKKGKCMVPCKRSKYHLLFVFEQTFLGNEQLFLLAVFVVESASIVESFYPKFL